MMIHQEDLLVDTLKNSTLSNKKKKTAMKILIFRLARSRLRNPKKE